LLLARYGHDCKGLVGFVNPHPRPVLSEIEGTGEGALAAGSDHDCKGLAGFVKPSRMRRMNFMTTLGCQVVEKSQML